MTTAITTAYVNPAARHWRTDPLRDSPALFHQSLPGYAPTPLIPVPALAQSLGVAAVLIKDESQRLGLSAFKVLGASYAIARALSARLGLDGAPALDVIREKLAAEKDITLVAATDGNHGRAVAHIAALLGLSSEIYVPPGVSDAARKAIISEGAKLVELELAYDDLVAHAATQCNESKVLIQDTSWEGYEDVPQWIVDGYITLVEEVDVQLAAQDFQRLDLVVVPAGVGSLAHGVVQHYRSTAHIPALLVAEPETAASVTTALHTGKVVPVATGETTMMGLNCGTVSEIAWPTLREGVDASVTVTDDQTLAAVRELASEGVDSGPCGAATLAALHTVAGDAGLRGQLGLTEESVVVLLSTEGTAANPKGTQ